MWQLDQGRFVLLGLPVQMRLGRTGFYDIRKYVHHGWRTISWLFTCGFVMWCLEAGDSTKRSGLSARRPWESPFGAP